MTARPRSGHQRGGINGSLLGDQEEPSSSIVARRLRPHVDKSPRRMGMMHTRVCRRSTRRSLQLPLPRSAFYRTA